MFVSLKLGLTVITLTHYSVIQKNFSVFHLDCDNFNVRKRCGGGLLILVPSALNAKLSCEPHCVDGYESLCVDLFLKTGLGRRIVRLCLVYRSPDFFDSRTSEAFCSHVSSLIPSRGPTFVVGDFNLPCIVWSRSCAVGRGPDTLESRFLHLTLECGLSQLVSEPTRGDNILDLLFSSEPNLVNVISVEEPFGASDHKAFRFLSGPLISLDSSNKKTGGYNFRKADYTGIAQALDHIDWATVFEQSTTAEQMWMSFLDISRSLIRKFVPKSKACKVPPGKKWSSTVHRLYLEQKRLHKKYRQNRSEESFNCWKQAAKEARKAARQEMVAREKEVLSSGSDNHFWRNINSRLTCKATIPVLKNDDGSLAMSDPEKADVFSRFFASVFQKDNTDKLQFEKEHVKPTTTVIFPPELVYAHLCSLPGKFSAGPDGLPSIFYKKLAFQLAQPLSSIFEVSFHSGALPTDWIRSNVTPIYKKGCKSNPSNYRPVCLTCVACRVMERIIKDVIIAHMSRNNLISPSQHGFLSRHSTVTQLLECLNEWTLAADAKESVDIAFADVSKAFDKLPHSKILESLEAYRIEGPLLKWLEAFLSNRSQRVLHNGCQSGDVEATSGIPQGSVLGPICFLLVINRLPKEIRHVSLKLFADDCKLYVRVKTNENFELFLEDLGNLFRWAQSNGLTLALDKTAIMHLGYSNPCNSYTVNDIELEEVDIVKDLGVHFSSNLKFANHINIVCKKAFNRANLIYKAFYCRTPRFLVHMFKTFVRPTLEYASPIWSPYLRKDIDLIERVQKYFTRRLPGFDGTYLERLSALEGIGIDLDILELRRLQTDLITVYKIIHRLCELDFSEFFQWSTATMVRGHSLRLQLPRSRLDCRRNFFSLRVILPWNSLSEETVSARTVTVFKKQLQTTEKLKLLSFLKGSVVTALNGRN